jgi:ligand-binding sensor domain-containing protein
MAWSRYIESPTGLEGEIWSGAIFHPRYYCDDPTVGTPVAIFATKPPVCHLQLDPTTQLLGQGIAWDISDSGSATSTIASFSIDWGGATDIGDLSGELWASDPLSGTVVYDALGTYEVNAFVVDLLGTESQHCISTVEIIEPEERVYIGTSDLGVFISDTGSTPAASNTGLSGDQLTGRALRLHPAYADLASAQQHVWLATKDGVSYSTDGGAAWANISKATLGDPTNTAADDPAPATADLDQIDLSFDPQDSRRVYLLRVTTTPKRAWLYVSDDDGASWSNTQVET